MLFINRKGIDENSYMITTKYIDIYDINQSLLFKENRLIKLRGGEKEEKIERKEEEKIEIERLEQTNNILGNNDVFIMDKERIEILIEDNNNISFYGAQLLNEGDYFNVQNKQQMVLYEMEIGEKYVDSFLLQSNYGDGFYIEIHDLPHFHQPMNESSSGHIILGKIGNDGEFILNAFKIPFGQALFIPPNVYHSDAYLVGKYNVVYGKTDDYKTLLFRNLKREIINVYIKSN
jgi:hypothetical protein